MKKVLSLFILSFICITASASNVLSFYNARVKACFTPNENCTGLIVKQIKAAKNTIYMQAYSFTSGKIAYALVRAHKRGVDVKVILDKSNFDCSRFSYGSLLVANGIPVWNDYEPNIAHNKVMIFDSRTVETGSFNFTKSAQYYNAENVAIVQSPAIAKQYINNWYSRQKLSKAIIKVQCPKRRYGRVYSLHR